MENLEFAMMLYSQGTGPCFWVNQLRCSSAEDMKAWWTLNCPQATPPKDIPSDDKLFWCVYSLTGSLEPSPQFCRKGVILLDRQAFGWRNLLQCAAELERELQQPERENIAFNVGYKKESKCETHDSPEMAEEIAAESRS